MKNQTNEAPLTLDLGADRLFRSLMEKLKQYRYPICASFLFGLLSYLFLFTNKLINHDELGNLFGLGASAESGRWGMDLISALIPSFSMPWFNGMLTLLLMTVSICLIVRIFSVRRPLLQVLLAGLIIVFPSLTGTFTYMFTSYSYGIAFLLSVLSVFFMTRKAWYTWLAGLLCCTLSVGIYQAYIAVTTSLLVLFLIQKTMYENDPVKEIFLEGIRFILLLGLSLGLYWGISRLQLHILGTQMNAYASSAMAPSDGIFERLKGCLLYFCYVLFAGLDAVVLPGLSRLAHILCGGIIGLEILRWILSRRDWHRILMLLFLLGVFPFAVTCILLFVEWSAVHTLVIYSFAVIYVLAAVVIEGSLSEVSPRQWMNRIRAGLLDLALLTMALVICCNIFIANQVSLRMYLSYQQNYAFATSLMANLHATDGYEPEMPVILVGRLSQDELASRFHNLEDMAGTHGFDSNSWAYGELFRLYCGEGIRLVNLPDAEMLAQIREHPEFQAMPAYPAAGYLRILDGQVIVKLPEK